MSWIPCLRPVHSRHMFALVILGCWVSIVLVYLFLLNRSTYIHEWHLHKTPLAVVNSTKFVQSLPPLHLVPLAPSEPRVLLVSAYRDPRMPDRVRVHAVGRIGLTQRLYCHIAFPNGSVLVATAPSFLVPAVPRSTVTYDGFFIDCPLPPGPPIHFQFVALSFNQSRPSSKFLRVRMTPFLVPSSPSLAACICPLHNGMSVSRRHLVAWIEMNRLLGVEKFVFYNYSAPASLQSMFYHYSQLGLVELLQWRLDPIPTAQIGSWPPFVDKLHYFGQFAAFNECLYRLLHRYRYIMFSDLDELLVPTAAGQSLPALISSLDAESNAAFSFRNVYLRSDFAKEPDAEGVLFLEYARREVKVQDQDVGPKMIVKADRVLRMGIHDVVEFAPNGASLVRFLTPEEGLLFHYKSPPKYLRQDSDLGVRDARVLAYRKDLLRNIRRTMNILEKMDKRK